MADNEAENIIETEDNWQQFFTSLLSILGDYEQLGNVENEA
jgi:hypothetical protein